MGTCQHLTWLDISMTAEYIGCIAHLGSIDMSHQVGGSGLSALYRFVAGLEEFRG